MKRHIFIMMLFALCLTSFQAHAQRYLPGMKGLQVTAGMTDGGALERWQWISPTTSGRRTAFTPRTPTAG